MKAPQKTVSYQLTRAERHPAGTMRHLHARKVTRVRIGTKYNGEPQFATYPDAQALCGVRVVTAVEEGTPGYGIRYTTCRRCRSELRKLGELK